MTGGRFKTTAWLQGDDALPTSHHDPKHNISIKPWRMGCARPWNGKYFRTSRGAAVAILKRDSNVQIRFRFTGHHGHGWVQRVLRAASAPSPLPGMDFAHENYVPENLFSTPSDASAPGGPQGAPAHLVRPLQR